MKFIKNIVNIFCFKYREFFDSINIFDQSRYNFLMLVVKASVRSCFLSFGFL